MLATAARGDMHQMGELLAQFVQDEQHSFATGMSLLEGFTEALQALRSGDGQSAAAHLEVAMTDASRLFESNRTDDVFGVLPAETCGPIGPEQNGTIFVRPADGWAALTAHGEDRPPPDDLDSVVDLEPPELEEGPRSLTQ
jgi:hypothetical protein